MKKMIRHVLVSITGSDESFRAAQYAILLSKAYGCRVTALYVVDTETLKKLVLAKILVADESADYESSLEQNGERYLNYVEALAKKKSVDIVTTTRRGGVYTEVLQAADELDADMIVIGGFEEVGTDNDQAASAQRTLLQNARRSVLVVKDPDIENQFRKA